MVSLVSLSLSTELAVVHVNPSGDIETSREHHADIVSVSCLHLWLCLGSSPAPEGNVWFLQQLNAKETTCSPACWAGEAQVQWFLSQLSHWKQLPVTSEWWNWTEILKLQDTESKTVGWKELKCSINLRGTVTTLMALFFFFASFSNHQWVEQQTRKTQKSSYGWHISGTRLKFVACLKFVASSKPRTHDWLGLMWAASIESKWKQTISLSSLSKCSQIISDQWVNTRPSRQPRKQIDPVIQSQRGCYDGWKKLSWYFPHFAADDLFYLQKQATSVFYQ